MSAMSDEQARIVFGMGGGRVAWSEVARPVGIQPMPDWVKGAWVNWGYGYANSPHVTLKVMGDVYNWPERRWKREHHGEHVAYIARSDDGRVKVHYHDGAVRTVGAWRNVLTPEQVSIIGHQADWSYVDPRPGETPEQAAHRGCAEWLKESTWLSDAEREKKKFEFKTVRATTQQQGYAGRCWAIPMDDGSEIVLRGPWHGGAPAGYVEVYTVDWAQENNVALAAKRAGAFRRHLQREINRPWFLRSATYGLYISEDLFLRIVARFIPHADVYRVERSYGVRLELAQPAWGAPKDVIYEQERKRAELKQPAGPHWRVKWDGRGGYCGSLRPPCYGFEPGVEQRAPEPWYA